jgi:hypothetical protein
MISIEENRKVGSARPGVFASVDFVQFEFRSCPTWQGVYKDRVRATPKVVERCAAEARTWIKMVSAGLDTEFPDWSIMLAFKVFNLNQSATITLRSELLACLSRISQHFALDRDSLISEYDDVVAFARRRYKNNEDNRQVCVETFRFALARKATSRLFTAVRNCVSGTAGGGLEVVLRVEF